MISSNPPTLPPPPLAVASDKAVVSPVSGTPEHQSFSESLDYELPVNSVSLAQRQREAGAERRHLYGWGAVSRCGGALPES